MMHISVISPVYNAEGCISELCRRLKSSVESITEDYEVILVEDRSSDNSWSEIQKEAKNNYRVKGVRLARNFGQHRAITAGLDLAKGDWVVVMDCDLQDAPEHIPFLYAKAMEGNEIVVTQFEERTESVYQQFISKVFWNVLSWLAGITFDYRIGNFRIMSKRVVENFRLYREQLRLLGGITNLMGFTVAYIPVSRDKRHHGETSYTVRQRIAVAIDIALAYSDKPLKVSVFFGLFISILSIIIGFSILLLASSGVMEVPGWASVIVSLYFIGGLIIANLGVVGYYIGKTFDETKRRPLYIIESKTHDKLPETRLKCYQPSSQKGNVLWITGLSGAGKSTLAREIVLRKKNECEEVILLDGDELREVFGASLINEGNHDRKARLMLAMQYSHLCKLLSNQGATVIIATISLFKEIHSWNRANLPGYFEVYLKVPVEELRLRDPKGIYRSYDEGKLKNIAGIDLIIDEPEAADLVIEFDPNRTTNDLAEEVVTCVSLGRNA